MRFSCHGRLVATLATLAMGTIPQYAVCQPAAAAGTVSAASKTEPAAETPKAGQPTKPVKEGQEAVKPAPTGLERLSDDWPKWIKVGVQYRGRVEAAGPATLVDGSYDRYYLNRLRLRSTVVANRWLSGTAEVQDSQVLDYEAGAVPRAMSDTFDLRQGYVEFAAKRSGREYLVRTGRQELTFGEGRLIASPDWGNTNRTYDIARVGFGMPGYRVDAFGGGVVQMEPGGFNHHVRGERFYGVYNVLSRALPKTTVEPYAVVRTLATATSELGGSGDASIQTYGARSVTRPSKSTELGVEVVMQRGHQAADSVEAWAEHVVFTWTPSHAPAKMQVSFEVNAASGDDNPRDGTRNTFDQLYPSNHAKYGLADRIAWRNMRDVAVGTQFAPAKKWKVGAGLHRLDLATVNDSYYGSSGSRLLLNRNATSRNVGWEGDGWCTWNISKELSVGPGLAVLVAGDYLKQTTGVERLWSPYVMWNVKF